MRENRYEDIRRDVVNRNGCEIRKGVEGKTSAGQHENKTTESASNTDQDQVYEEYNSWS